MADFAGSEYSESLIDEIPHNLSAWAQLNRQPMPQRTGIPIVRQASRFSGLGQHARQAGTLFCSAPKFRRTTKNHELDVPCPTLIRVGVDFLAQG
jgi:hypothetical protein